ncbi:MAG: hypothetical protein ABIU09_10640, partial [Pyrinomonadaceae bacterium]
MKKEIFHAETPRRGAKTKFFVPDKNIMNRILSFLLSPLNSASLRLCVSTVLLMPAVLAQSDGSQQNKTGRAGTFAIVNARIVTVSGAVIENGTVVIQNGKIASVGASLSVPSGAERIEGKGLSVYPGMIDSASAMGLAEVGQGANATIDAAETGTNNANAKAISGVNPHSSHINVTRVNGVTTVMSAPSG